MSRELCTKLDVPIELCWENFIHLIREVNGGVDKAHDLFYHSELDSCLIKHFDRLFGTTDFPFNIKKAKKHAEILNILDAVDIKALDRHIDILGFVYELHLKTGASAARDLGQFFTDRNICKYMTDLCEPAFKEPGVPETVCDPTMGTGGFLTSFIKYYETTYPDAPINWSAQEKQINGCDTDPKVAGIARLNLFMETGGCRMNNILTHDSLYGDLPQVGYDVILANMPFGLKGLKHEECCKKIQDLKIGGNKSEPLFLQLMCASLNPGGRCAVVVPDGMLSNISKCHNETRKYLLNNFEVIRIVKMSGDFFMNTSIQTSIIFFKNSGTPTTHVEFWEVTKAKTGEIVEELIVDVPRDYFDENCSLNMKLYIAEEEKPVINPEEFTTVKLGDIVSIETGTYITQKDAVEKGYPIYGGGDACKYYALTANRHNRMIIAKDGISPKCVRWISEEFYLNHHGWTLKCNETIIEKYLYYYLVLHQQELYELASGSAQKGLNQKTIELFSICVPPLDIQHEIVASLDRIYAPGTTKLADTLKQTDKAMDLVLANPGSAILEPIVETRRLVHKSMQIVADIKSQMIADIKTQMVDIMKAVEKRGCPMMKLQDLYEIPKSIVKFNSSDVDNTGDAQFFNGKWNSPIGVHSQHSYTSDKNYFVIIKDGGGDHSSDTVGMGKFFNVSGKCAITSHNAILIQKKENTNLHRFIHYYMQSKIKELRDKATYSINLGSIAMSDILGFDIAVPSEKLAIDYLKCLDALQTQINALEQLQRQSDDNARFILESYLPKSNVDDIEETVV